jgi:hypothetical protein
LFFYSTIFPFMAHGVSFTLVTLVFYQAKALHDNAHNSSTRYILLAITCGFIFLVRPQQVLLLPLLVPFVWSSLRYHPRRLPIILLSLALVISVAAILPLCNYLQAGVLTINTYSSNGEGFNWLRPEFFIVLLSPSRGILWMNPIVFLAALGYIMLYRQIGARSWLSWALFIHAIVQMYLIACWSSPEQGDAFGSRMWIECTPFVALGVAVLLATSRKALRWVYAGLSMLSMTWTSALMLLYMGGQLQLTSSYEDIVAQVWHMLVW